MREPWDQGGHGLIGYWGTKLCLMTYWTRLLSNLGVVGGVSCFSRSIKDCDSCLFACDDGYRRLREVSGDEQR